MRYAQNTGVPVERSKGEIERLLSRYGASKFAHGWDREKAVVMFHAHERMIRFTLPLPDRKDFSTTPTGRERKNPHATEQAWETACRQRWRALCLVIKAKLEAVEHVVHCAAASSAVSAASSAASAASSSAFLMPIERSISSVSAANASSTTSIFVPALISFG